jgi:hypothetical protein
MPLRLLVDHFFQKGGYTPAQLRVKMKEVIANSTIRPNLGKNVVAPLWIPRIDVDYLVVTCPECVRSSSVADGTASGELQQTDCLVDSTNLKLLEQKKGLLPSL